MIKSVKKALAIIVCCSLSAFSLMGAAAPEQSVKSQSRLFEKAQQKIIQETLDQNDTISIKPENFEVVSIEDAANTTFTCSTFSNDLKTNFAEGAVLRAIETDGDLATVTVITPYKIDEETGELVNSFAYAASVIDDFGSVGELDVNGYANVSVSTKIYTRITSLDYGLSGVYYRPLGFEAAWNAKVSNVTTTKMTANVEVCGDSFLYSDLASQGSSAPVQDYDYVWSTSYTQTNPDEGYYYAKYSPLSDTLRLWCRQGTDQGLCMAFTINYKLNGVSKTTVMDYNMEMGKIVWE